MKTNKKTTWITIPEESAVKKTSSKPQKLSDKVTHKGFWAAGLIALIVFTFVLSMPQQLSKFMKAELFDGDFKVIPENQAQEDNEFFAKLDNAAPSEEEAETETPAGNESLQSETLELQNTSPSESQVQVESDAVPIQIDPIETPTEAETPEEEVPSAEDLLNEETSPSSEQEEESSDLEQLLESLNAQLEELKKDSLKKDQEIQDLMAQLQSGSLHNAANNQTPPANQQNTPPLGNTTFNGDPGNYRYNTHTVTVNPYDVLAQNRVSASQLQAQALQANMVQNVQSVNPSNNLTLSNVQHQPATGPGEALMLALILSSVAILGFGIYRSARA